MGNFSLFLLGREEALWLPAKGRNVSCLAIREAQGLWKPASLSVQHQEPKGFVTRLEKVFTGASIMESSCKSVF